MKSAQTYTNTPQAKLAFTIFALLNYLNVRFIFHEIDSTKIQTAVTLPEKQSWWTCSMTFYKKLHKADIFPFPFNKKLLCDHSIPDHGDHSITDHGDHLISAPWSLLLWSLDHCPLFINLTVITVLRNCPITDFCDRLITDLCKHSILFTTEHHVIEVKSSFLTSCAKTVYKTLSNIPKEHSFPHKHEMSQATREPGTIYTGVNGYLINVCIQTQLILDVWINMVWQIY